MVPAGNAGGHQRRGRPLRQDDLHPERRPRRGARSPSRERGLRRPPARRRSHPGLREGRRRAPADRARPRRRGLGDRHRRLRLHAQEPRQVRGRVRPPARRQLRRLLRQGQGRHRRPRSRRRSTALKADGTLAGIAEKYAMDPAILEADRVASTPRSIEARRTATRSSGLGAPALGAPGRARSERGLRRRHLPRGADLEGPARGRRRSRSRSTVVAFVAGLAIGAGRRAPARQPVPRRARRCGWTYIWIFRAHPDARPAVLRLERAAAADPGAPRTGVHAVLAAAIALALNEAAYAAEIIRGGLLSIDDGQRLAARALGMRPAVGVPAGSSRRSSSGSSSRRWPTTSSRCSSSRASPTWSRCARS